MEVMYRDQPADAVARRPAWLDLLTAGLLVAAVVLHLVAMFPSYFGGSIGQGSVWSQPDQAALYAVVTAGWALALALTLSGPARIRLGAGIAVGLAVTEFGFRFADVGEALHYGVGQSSTGMWLMTAGWVAGAAGAIVAVLAVLRRSRVDARGSGDQPAAGRRLPWPVAKAGPNPSLPTGRLPPMRAGLEPQPDPGWTPAGPRAAARPALDPPGRLNGSPIGAGLRRRCPTTARSGLGSAGGAPPSGPIRAGLRRGCRNHGRIGAGQGGGARTATGPQSQPPGAVPLSTARWPHGIRRPPTRRHLPTPVFERPSTTSGRGTRAGSPGARFPDFRSSRPPRPRPVDATRAGSARADHAFRVGPAAGCRSDAPTPPGPRPAPSGPYGARLDRCWSRCSPCSPPARFCRPGIATSG